MYYKKKKGGKMESQFCFSERESLKLECSLSQQHGERDHFTFQTKKETGEGGGGKKRKVYDGIVQGKWVVHDAKYYIEYGRKKETYPAFSVTKRRKKGGKGTGTFSLRGR